MRPGKERVRGRQFYVIRHSADLDDHVTELIDTLIGLRIAHPRLVQLELARTPPWARQKAWRPEVAP